MINSFSAYEPFFLSWREDGYPGVMPATYDYINYLTSDEDDMRAREGTLWPHQWDSFLRVIYCHEILRQDIVGGTGVLLNIVTGGGKTAIIGALTAWLRISHNIEKFLIICPNLIVRDRLVSDFKGGKVFVDRDLLPKSSILKPSDFDLTELGGDKGGTYMNLLSAKVVLGNIHQFYATNKSGQSNLAALMEGHDFALFNDEAHNSPAEEYENTLRRIQSKTALRVDLTATPDRADGQVPTTRMIYEYGINDALADSMIKTPVVYQPSITQVELTYTDAKTGERRKFEQIDWEDVERLGLSATQWVTDDEPMRQQMAIALKRLEEQEARAKKRWTPVLFVVAVCKDDAIKAHETLNKYFKVKALLVTEDSDEEDRKRATEMGRQKKTAEPYRAVVSVLMLREGWDVPEVGVILLLRKFSSRVYGQQVVGRGLRRVRVNGVAEDEPQICAVVDHPKLEHRWLWELFGSKVRENVLIDQQFDETEDLPPKPQKQELERPEKLIKIPEPDPAFVDDSPFVLDPIAPPGPAREDWREILAGFEYDDTAVEITKVKIDSVRGQELIGERWQSMHSAPELAEPEVLLEAPDDRMRDAIKERLLLMADDLTEQAGYAGGFKERVYGALIAHVRERFLGTSLGLAERKQLEYAWKMLAAVKKQVQAVPGLVAGMIEYAD